MMNAHTTSIIGSFALACVIASTLPVAGVAAQDQKQPSAEISSLERIRDQVQAFERRVTDLSRKSKVTPDEYSAVKQQADSVKKLLPDFQRLVASSIAKQKAAGQWTEKVESNVAEASRKTGKMAEWSAIQAQGGARKALESAASGTDDIAADLENQLRDLNAKQSLIASMFEALLGQRLEAYKLARDIGYIVAMTCWAQGIYPGYCGL